MSGQLGDVPTPPTTSPKKQPPAPAPALSSTPAVVDSKPVVEAPDATPPTSESKVEPTTTPISPKLSSSDPENIPQEAPQTTDDLVSENVIHPEEKLPDSVSLAEGTDEIQAGEKQQDSSGKTETSDSDQQTQSASVSEIPATEQQQSSCESAEAKAEAAEPPHLDTQTPNTEQQAQSALVSEVPAGEEEQSSSEKMTGDVPNPVESETQNRITDGGFDKAVESVEAETELNPEITQSEGAVPLADQEKVEQTPEKPPEMTTNVSETSQEAATASSDSTALNVNEEKVATSEQVPSVDSSPADHEKVEQTPEKPPEMTTNVSETTQEVTPAPPDSTVLNVNEEKVARSEQVTSTDQSTADLKVEVTPELGVKGETTSKDQTEMTPMDISAKKTEAKEQEVKPETIKSAECESATGEKHTEDECQSNNVENTSPEKENKEIEITTPISAVEALEKVIQVAVEGKKSEKCVDGSDSAQEKESGDAQQESSKMERKTEAEIKALEDEASNLKIQQETVREEEVNKAGSTPAVSNTETGRISVLSERNESEKAEEPIQCVPEEMSKEEINEEIKPGKSELAAESHSEEVLLSQKSKEADKSEEVSQKREGETLDKNMQKADMNSDEAVVICRTAPPECEEREKVSSEVPEQSVEMVSSSTNISETPASVERPSAERAASSAAENQDELKLIVEPSVREKDAEDDRKTNDTSVFDGAKSTASKKDEAESAPVVPIPVEEPEIQAVVSEQDESPKEVCSEAKNEAEVPPQENKNNEDAPSEVTLVVRRSRGRLETPRGIHRKPSLKTSH